MCDLCPDQSAIKTLIDEQTETKVNLCGTCATKCANKDPKMQQKWRSWVNSCEAAKTYRPDEKEECPRCKRYNTDVQFHANGHWQAVVYKCKSCKHTWSDMEKT